MSKKKTILIMSRKAGLGITTGPDASGKSHRFQLVNGQLEIPADHPGLPELVRIAKDPRRLFHLADVGGDVQPFAAPSADASDAAEPDDHDTDDGSGEADEQPAPARRGRRRNA